LHVRRATRDDLLAAFRIANDPSVRGNSFHDQPIPLADHVAWFEAKVGSPEVRFWVLEVAETPVGVIRYERISETTVEAHFAIAAALRGKGLGTQALRSTADASARELGASCVRGV